MTSSGNGVLLTPERDPKMLHKAHFSNPQKLPNATVMRSLVYRVNTGLHHDVPIRYPVKITQVKCDGSTVITHLAMVTPD